MYASLTIDGAHAGVWYTITSLYMFNWWVQKASNKGKFWALITTHYAWMISGAIIWNPYFLTFLPDFFSFLRIIQLYLRFRPRGAIKKVHYLIHFFSWCMHFIFIAILSLFPVLDWTCTSCIKPLVHHDSSCTVST